MTKCRRSFAFELQFFGWEEGEWEGAGTTEPRLEEYCVHSLFRIPYGKSTGRKKRELYKFYRIYSKMEHPISRRNDKPCRPSLQSDLDLYCLLLLRPVSANI